jgi:hypothetical protein
MKITLNYPKTTGYNGPSVHCGGMGFVQATVVVGVIFVVNFLIKRFELIVIHFALIRNSFYPDIPGKLVKMPVLLLCRIFV